MKKIVLYIIFSLLLGFTAKSTHIVGGEAYYDYLGNNQYRISLVVYRDCLLGQAQFDRPANLTIFKNKNQFFHLEHVNPTSITTLPADIYDSCFSIPTGICVERGYYETVVTIPQSTGEYTISWQRCCRNNSIKNITIPGDWGSTITTTIPSSLLTVGNSSPRYNNRPPLAICLGSDFRFDHSASDPDGDSLSYELCEIFHGGGKQQPGTGANSPKPDTASPPPYTNVTWGAGFSAANPIDANPAFAIDPNTGLLTGTPINTGQYVFGICTYEYRNGILIGISRREYQVNVVTCVSATRADMVTPQPCQGLDLTFINTSLNTNSYHWDFGIAGTNADTSNLRDGQITFPDSGTYQITLIANPGWRCADSIKKTVTVYHDLEAAIDSIPGKCFHEANFNFMAAGNFQGYTSFNWNFGNQASPTSSTDQNPMNISYPDTGKYPITLTMSHKGCTSTASGFAIVYPGIQPKIFVRNKGGCSPLEVFLEDQSKAWTQVHRIWKVDNQVYRDSIVRLTFTEPGDYVISHEAFTTEGCIDTVEPKYQVVTVIPGPTAGFTISETEVNIFDPHVVVSDQSIDAHSCSIFFGDEVISANCNDEHYFEKPGKFKVSQIVSSSNGCSDTASVYVEVENEFAFFIPNSFTPNQDGNNEVFKPIVVGAKSIEFTVFDRWGNVVFETESLNHGWNGSRKNEDGDAGIGTYVYKVKVKDFLDEFHFYEGNVHLVR